MKLAERPVVDVVSQADGTFLVRVDWEALGWPKSVYAGVVARLALAGIIARAVSASREFKRRAKP